MKSSGRDRNDFVVVQCEGRRAKWIAVYDPARHEIGDRFAREDYADAEAARRNRVVGIAAKKLKQSELPFDA